MTVTGLTKVLEDISEEIYKDLLMILPWSVFFTILVHLGNSSFVEGCRHYRYTNYDGPFSNIRNFSDYGCSSYAYDRRNIPDLNWFRS